MALIQITVQFRPQDTHTQQTIVLDGARYQFDTYTNKFDDTWYLDVRNSDGVAQVYGIALVPGLNLLFQYQQYLDVPQGILWVQSTQSPAIDPALDSFDMLSASMYYLDLEGIQEAQDQVAA